MKFSFCIRVFLLLVYCQTLACDHVKNEGKGSEAIRIVDDLGRTVVFYGSPSRVVSLAPNITEIVFFLGCGDKLVGVTNQCDWPPAAGSLTKVGDFSNPSIERIIDLSPDLVLTTSLEQDRWVVKLSSLGIKVFSIYPGDCEELVNSMKKLLKVLGETRAGSDSIRFFEEKIVALESIPGNTGAERPRVFVEISDSPLMTAGDDSFVSDLIERAGGLNIAMGLQREYCIINPERVIRDDPEVIFIFHGLASRDELSRRIGWANIEAVKSGRVFDDVNPDYVLRPGPRVIKGIISLRERLHGED